MKKSVYCSNSEQLSKALGIKNKLKAIKEKLSFLFKAPLVISHNNIIESERTPWGGTKIQKLYYPKSKQSTIGETWDISGHPLYPSHIICPTPEYNIELPLPLLEQLYPEHLTCNAPKLHSLPYLCKLLNSGSIQNLRDEVSLIFNKYRHLDLSNIIGDHSHLSSKYLDSLNADQLHQLLRKIKNSNTIRKQPSGALFSTAIEILDQKITEKNLSIQLHPYTSIDDNNLKKDELWLVLDVDPGSGIYLGIKENCSIPEFINTANKNKDVSSLMNFFPVKPFDLICIPSGTLHSLGSGMCVLEIQSSSDTTYRAYDWKREAMGKVRDLHLEQLKSNILPKTNQMTSIKNLIYSNVTKNNSFIEKGYYKMSPFDSFQANLKFMKPQAASHVIQPNPKKLTSYFILEGSICVNSADTDNQTFLDKGDSFICPSTIDKFKVQVLTPLIIIEIF